MELPALKILMIDDDEGVFQSIRNKAASHSIHLLYAQSLAEGLSVLDSDSKIRGIILDGKGFIEKGQSKGSENSSFVFQALQELRLYEERNRKYFSKVIFTAWYDQLLEPVGDKVKIFDKKKAAYFEDELVNMFSELRKEIESSEDYELIQFHKNAFDLFDNQYLKEADADILLKILRKQKMKTPSFNEIRKVLEKVYNRLNGKDIRLIPNDLFHKKDSPNFTYIVRYFEGQQVGKRENILYKRTGKKLIPDHILYCMDFISRSCGALSHSYNYKTNLHVNFALVSALLEILDWLKATIDTKNPFQ